MERLARLWPPIVSAGLLLLAFAPANFSLLVFVALVPWLSQLREFLKDPRPGRSGWKSGYLFGTVYGVGQLLWLGSFVSRWTQSWLVGAIPLVVCTMLYALYFGLAGWLITSCWRWDRPWLIPLVWAGVEVLRSYMPTFAFPWGILASPLWPYGPLNQSAYYLTVFGVSAWCVLASTIVAMLLDGSGFAKVRPLVYAWTVVLILSLIRFSATTPTTKFVVTAAQPGVDMAFGDPATADEDLRRAIDPILLAANLNGSQLVVLPEGLADAKTLPPKTPFSLFGSVPIVFGAQRSANPSYQSAFAYDGAFRYVDKTRLVIFGEFVPFRGVIPYPESFRLPSGDLAPGTAGVRSLDVAGLRVGPVICFEGLFPDIAYRQTLNGARLIVVPSIDDWYMGSNAPEQLMAAAIWRSIETGTPVVRSASTGYTFATDDHGRIINIAPLGKSLGMRMEIAVPDHPASFRFLPTFPIVTLLVLIAVVGLAIWSRPTSTGMPRTQKHC